MAPKGQAELADEDGLVAGGLDDAALANLPAVAGLGDDVGHANGLQFVEDLSWLIPQPRGARHLPQRLPQDERHEVHQDVGRNAIGALAPDGPYLQRSVLWMRKASSACVSWMYACHSSSGVQSVTFVRSM